MTEKNKKPACVLQHTNGQGQERATGAISHNYCITAASESQSRSSCKNRG